MGLKLKTDADTLSRAPFSWDNLPTSPSVSTPSDTPPSPPTLWLDAKHMKIFGAEPLRPEFAIVKCNECGKPVQRSSVSEHADRCRSIRSSGKKSGKVDGKKRKADDDETLEEESGVKKKKPATKITKGRSKGPVDLDRQCGVINDKGLPCSRALTCKSHAMGAKRSVKGRSKDYDDLLNDFYRERDPNWNPVKRTTKEERKQKKEKEKAEKKRLAAEAAAAAKAAKQAAAAEAGGGNGSGGATKKGKKVQKENAMASTALQGDVEDENMDDVDSEAELEAMVKAVRIAQVKSVIATPLAVPYDAGTWFVARRERLRDCREELAEALMPRATPLPTNPPVRMPT